MLFNISGIIIQMLSHHIHLDYVGYIKMKTIKEWVTSEEERKNYLRMTKSWKMKAQFWLTLIVFYSYRKIVILETSGKFSVP